MILWTRYEQNIRCGQFCVKDEAFIWYFIDLFTLEAIFVYENDDGYSNACKLGLNHSVDSVLYWIDKCDLKIIDYW